MENTNFIRHYTINVDMIDHEHGWSIQVVKLECQEKLLIQKCIVKFAIHYFLT